ncbi:hypothetical protein E8E11_000207 [Didymella keratinophila]|uniref:Uncharacterized protein n=1 Tax=Didymella heteroderae TaxID=1769908 RepID=A0A9P5BV99_9PLEO|nr:hypothetical protein E8E12_000923 [Didymella heteroderae]KAF3032410.1 hypothetical protein E8E11_000207 [Didymella keratinophila]
MSTQNTRDATVALTDSNSWTAWYRQFKIKCEALSIWKLADSSSSIEPKQRPTLPLPPLIADYESIASSTPLTSTASSSRTRGNTQPTRRDEFIVATLPTRVSDLTPQGQEEYKDDREDYKIQLEAYKLQEKEYQEEHTRYGQLISHILGTVSPHLHLSCCESGKTVREWVVLLQETVGVDAQEERTHARERYHAALKPMRASSQWETWLMEYDQAATRAEALQVGEVRDIDDVTTDFLGAVSKVAPTWVATFSGPGYDRTTNNRKKMMKLFRDYMSLSYPIKGKQKSAFAAGEASYLAGGAPDQDISRDASDVSQRAPSAQSQGNPGKPRQKRKFDGHQETRSKQFPKRNTAAAGDDCSACGQRHNLSDCYYAYPEKAPEWFKPNRTIARLVEYKTNNDDELQRAMNNCSPSGTIARQTSSSRSNKSTPKIKMSQTPDLQME